jgi:hypothetical protein
MTVSTANFIKTIFVGVFHEAKTVLYLSILPSVCDLISANKSFKTIFMKLVCSSLENRSCRRGAIFLKIGPVAVFLYGKSE